MRRLIFATLLVLCGSFTAHAQTLQGILQTHVDEVAKPSRRGVAIVLDDLVASGLPQATPFLEQWAERNVWQRDDGLFFIVTDEGETLTLKDVDTGAALSGTKEAFSQVRPNGGVRRAIGTALVQFQLSDPEISRRQAAVDSIARRGTAEQLAPLRASIAGETDPDLRARKEQLVNFLAARFSDDPAERIAAIKGLSGDISVETRAVLNQILTTKDGVATQEPAGNIAALRDPMQDPEAAYAELVAAKLAPPRQTASEIRAVLEANIDAGRVGGVPLAQLNTIPAREQAYAALAAADLAPELITAAYRDSAIDAHVFYTLYDEDDVTVTAAAEAALAEVEARVGRATFVDLTLDALSLASIFFLAAIGLAITFGVMKVINMAHGEFIMMGAYTGFVVQQFIPNYTVSILVALPLAFAVTFGAGVLMERLVIRHLYHRPLETLLATFGISIALQQLAKNIFGTQARPLTSPDWLAGAWVLNDVVQISYIRIAIFVLAFIFLGLILFILKRTRLGLEVRAVTQNPGMASSMGINPDRINMMTFGLGSGIAGIAGVAIGLYAKVTSEMGADYIVQSFMTVVVGGVGNVWGTLAGATLIGFGQKGIEWLNPSNTLAAQTYMILLVILFIQFRPRGIVALKGRAAGDD
ncbi:urea ABC transporter permease subunit UrtB [Thalassobacter stenotrophicus]|uniref:urea ABC transporter permease subunit UrtB n=1 Tax=Thalassobacter stenotrophicus TaxID=266809 RepID=UPI000D5D557D|nr:urea ABC transporter permease subunit UrtB [Thalassobacter stenotrophicus]PVZ49942.1 urea ABC transporter permease subunit UrtB [Thalassobacter stenotrophicus]